MQNFPIDLVVTYVDDRDPVWQNAIQQHNNDDMMPMNSKTISP